MRRVASLILLLATCTACASLGATVPFSTLAKGLASGVDEPAQVVVHSQTEWAALWSRHIGTQTAPPPVDFSRDMVLALFMGARPTGGYAIEITQVERASAGLSIRYRTTRPDPSAMHTQALTQPFHLIALPRVDGPVTFVEETSRP